MPFPKVTLELASSEVVLEDQDLIKIVLYHACIGVITELANWLYDLLDLGMMIRNRLVSLNPEVLREVVSIDTVHIRSIVITRSFSIVLLSGPVEFYCV